VLDQLADSRFAFWVIALLIVAIDSLVFLKPGEFAYRIERGTRVRIRVSPFPYLMRGREPIVTLLTYPVTPFFLCFVSARSRTRSEVRLVLIEAKRLARSCAPLSILAMLSLVMFTVFGPVLSFRSNTGHAIVIVYSMSYLISASAIFYLWLEREAFQLLRWQLLKICMELVFCPFLMANIVKKVSWQNIEQLSAGDLTENFSSDPEITMNLMRSNMEENSVPLE
jgi:hypothetical protein